MNAGCVHHAEGSVDVAYVERMRNLLDGLNGEKRAGAKLLLYAFEHAYDERGARDLDHSMFHVPNGYAREVARRHPQYFEWVASIHPYRADALAELEKARAGGARAVKWLPAAMGIDPASPRCDRFYESLARADVPLIVHAGEERAVLGRGAHELGNPLRLRRALEAGVRVVVAHCASLGEDRDLDKGENAGYAPSFSLFVRLFEKYPNCYADVSAITQTNRAGPALARIIEEEGWHARLLNGSDYPLPGVMPIFSVQYLVALGLLDEKAAPVLTEIRQHNPLLFDFVLKRRLRSKGRALSRRVFETRAFFVR